MSFLKLLQRRKLGSVRKQQRDITKTSSSSLGETDILLAIATDLDAGSILSLRLVNKAIAENLKHNESWICKAIASKEYGWVFRYDDSSFRDTDNPAVHLQITSFKMLIRLHLATQLPILLLWNRYKDISDPNTTFIVPGVRVTATCVRGFLTLWALADIDQKLENTPSTWLPRMEYFTFSKLAQPFVCPGDHHQGMELDVPCTRKSSYSQWLEKAQARISVSGNLGSLFSGSRRQRPSPLDHQLRAHQESRTKRLEFISQLDQGAWLDLHIVTTLVLAFYISFADSTIRRRSESTTDKLALAEWGLRQGPDPILGLLSVKPTRTRWTTKWIDKQWRMRHDDVKALDGDWNVGPIGISTATTGRYPHPKCQEWEDQGWPSLVESTKTLLFRDWRSYHLQTHSQAEKLVEALEQRTGNISFQTRM